MKKRIKKIIIIIIVILLVIIALDVGIRIIYPLKSDYSITIYSEMSVKKRSGEPILPSGHIAPNTYTISKRGILYCEDSMKKVIDICQFMKLKTKGINEENISKILPYDKECSFADIEEID